MKRVTHLALVSLMLMVLFAPIVSAQEEPCGPKIDTLRYIVIRNPDARLSAMESGLVNVLTQITRAADIDSLSQNCYTLTSTSSYHISFIGFNIRPDQSYRRPEITLWPLADVDFRHALAHSFDREGIVASVYGCTGTPLQSLVPPAYGGWANPAVPTHPYNLGDPFTSPPGEHSTCGILREAGYTFIDADFGGTVTNVDYWNMPNGEPLPKLTILSPLEGVDPQKNAVVSLWLAACAEIGLVSTAHNGQSGLTQIARDLGDYAWDIYMMADFDIFIINFKLGRFPDYLYDWFHSSQDSLYYPLAYNAFGVNDSTLNGLLETLKFSIYHEEKVIAAMQIQEWLADPNILPGLPVLPVYSMIHFDAFDPDIAEYSIVESSGFGAGDGGCVALKEPNGPSPFWTYLNIHWELGVEPNVLHWCLSDESQRLNPLCAGTTSAWEIMDRVFDPLIMINPYTHEDIPWMADSWQITQTATGMDVTFHLRDDVYWQDGSLYTAHDAEFSLEFLRNNQISKYKPAWEHIVDVEVTSDFTFTVHADVTSQFLMYDWAVLAALLPPQVWADWNGLPLVEILARDLSVEPGWNGVTPTNLFGTGPFVFDFYDSVGLVGGLHANRQYFKTTAEIQDQLVEMLHWAGNVNYPGSYFESAYAEMSIGVDDYITVIDQALMDRAYGAIRGLDPCGVGWGFYNPDADVNEDDIIHVDDISLANYFFGLNYHYSPFETVPGKPKVRAVPPQGAIQIGQQFTVDISIKNVEGLNTYEFTLKWDIKSLRLISIVGGGFISEEGSNLPSITGKDYVYVGDRLVGSGLPPEPPSESGSGTLAKITFECLDKGKVTIDLSSRLLDIDLTSMRHMDIDAVVPQRP